MATAPPPGIGKQRESAHDAEQVMTITVNGEGHTLALNNIPMKERMAVRKQIGLPLEEFIGQVQGSGASKMGLDTLCVFWWLSRRANGEAGLSWEQAESEWPADLDDLDVDVATAASADDPEV